MPMRRLLPLALVAAIVTIIFHTHPVGAATIKSITLTPTSTAPTADQTVACTVTANDDSGKTADVTAQAIISTNDPMGVISGTSYRPGKVGSWTLQATYQSFVTTTVMTITPGAIAAIDINPNSGPEVVALDTTRHFAITGFDQRNNIVVVPSVEWSVVGGIGTIDTKGVFTPVQTGTGKIQAKTGTITASIDMQVVPAPVTTPIMVANSNTAATTQKSTNSNVNAGVKTSSTTSATVNVNAPAATNANTNSVVVNTNTAVNKAAAKTTTKTCTTMSPWLWVLVMVAWLFILVFLYAVAPVSRLWPAGIGLVGAAALIVLQQTKGCHQLAWWPWIMAIGTIGLTLLAIRQSPSEQH